MAPQKPLGYTPGRCSTDPPDPAAGHKVIGAPTAGDPEARPVAGSRALKRSVAEILARRVTRADAAAALAHCLKARPEHQMLVRLPPFIAIALLRSLTQEDHRWPTTA